MLFLTDGFVAEALQLLEGALANITNEATAQRMEMVIAPLIYLKWARLDESDPLRGALLDRFEETARRGGVAFLSERTTLDAWLEKVRAGN